MGEYEGEQKTAEIAFVSPGLLKMALPVLMFIFHLFFCTPKVGPCFKIGVPQSEKSLTSRVLYYVFFSKHQKPLLLKRRGSPHACLLYIKLLPDARAFKIAFFKPRTLWFVRRKSMWSETEKRWRFYETWHSEDRQSRVSWRLRFISPERIK